VSTSLALAIAVTFVWLGMVLAISFLEAPLKFRAPGVTLPIGLGIGRLVFRALNGVELLLALATAILVASASPAGSVIAVAALAPALLLAQLAVVRPRLHRRTAAVVAGAAARRSRAHLGYVALECAKVLSLAVAGACLLTA
jgi:hypothetical protein